MLKKSYGLNMQHLDFAALLSVIPSPCLPFSDLCNPPLKCWSMYLKAQDSPHNLCSRKGGTMFKIKLWVEDQKTSINFTFYAIFSSKEAVLFGYQLAEHGFYPLPLGKPAGRGPGELPCWGYQPKPALLYAGVPYRSSDSAFHLNEYTLISWNKVNSAGKWKAHLPWDRF